MSRPCSRLTLASYRTPRRGGFCRTRRWHPCLHMAARSSHGERSISLLPGTSRCTFVRAGHGNRERWGPADRPRGKLGSGGPAPREAPTALGVSHNSSAVLVMVQGVRGDAGTLAQLLAALG